MSNCIVRIINIRLEHFKNVKQGNIKFRNYTKLKKTLSLDKGDVLGIYGQNGSGKTVVVEALGLFQQLLIGEQLTEEIEYLIALDSNHATLAMDFFVEVADEKYLLFYEVTVSRVEGQGICVTKESLASSLLKEGRRKSRNTLIEYNLHSEQVVKLGSRYKEVIEDRELMDLHKGTSFIFNREIRKVLRERLGLENPLVILSKVLYQFAYFQLFVVARGKIGIMERLFDTSLIPENLQEAFLIRMSQMNEVLEVLIAGMHLEVEPGWREGKGKVLVVREGIKVPLNRESQGVQKMVTILSVLIAIYNKPNICAVVDDIDAGIFEYLLGQLLEIFNEELEGQLIFTAQNLRVLEKLDKDCVIFTTINPENKYIYLENVTKKNNLRDVYLRAIASGGQKEELYRGVDTQEIHKALRNAGRIREVIK